MQDKNILISKKISRRTLVFLSAVVVFLIASQIHQLRPVVILAGILSLMISDENNSDKILVFSASALGLLPIFGWLGFINAHFDAFLFLAAISLSHSCSVVVKRKTVIDVKVPPALFGSVITYIWWRPVLDSSPVVTLARLIPGWDHFGHFYLFVSAKVHRKFVTLLDSEIVGSTIYDKKYPAGIHMSWAQWWNDLEIEAALHPSVALHQYFLSVILTVSLCIALLSISVARISQFRVVQIVSAISATCLFVGYICFGHLSMVIWSGFPNFIVAITGAVLAISFSIRPSSSHWISLVAIAGSSAMVTYNWYPLLIPIAPVVLFALWNSSRKLLGSQRVLFYLANILSGVLIAIPGALALSLGAQHLAVPGGVNNLPPQLIVLILLLGGGIATALLARDFTWRKAVEVSPLFSAGLFQLIVTVPIRLSEGTYPYYPQKIAYGMVFIVLSYMFFYGVKFIDQNWTKLPTREKILRSSSVIAVTLSATQLFGYVGPDWMAVSSAYTAPGIPLRDFVVNNVPTKHRISTILLNVEKLASISDSQTRHCLVLDDTEMQEYDPVLVNYWVGTLTWSLTEEHLLRAQKLIPIKTSQADPVLNAQVLDKLLKIDSDCPIVPRPVANELVARNSQWAVRTWVIESDGSIAKFVDEE